MRSQHATRSLDPAQFDCQDLVELITEFLEGTLPPAEHEQFEKHIDICEGCEIYLEQMRAALEVSGRIREEDVGPESMGKLLDAFRWWKR